MIENYFALLYGGIKKEEGNILLFMDEVHTLIGAGGAEGAHHLG